MAAHGKFGTILNCMDGRTQDQANALAKSLFAVDHIDAITEPGIDAILAGGPHAVLNESQLLMMTDWIRAKADISANGHGSKSCLIVGHCSCAGNPVALPEHIEHLRRAQRTVTGWGLFDDVRIAVFDDNWKLSEV